ncbi:MAG: hypothetical protein R3D67_16815 [Hyphomicrobiaceae bacterium]
MSKRSIILATAALLLAGGAAVAISAPGDGPGGWRGHGMHRMGGGMGPMGEDGMESMGGRHMKGMRGHFGRTMTKEDFDTRTRERFAALDKNSDGVIDKAEMEAAVAARSSKRMGRRGMEQGQMGQRMLKRMGAGADGKVSKEAFRAEINRRFAEADLNSDGKLDDADLPPMMRGRNALDHIGESRGRRGGALGWVKRLGVSAKAGVITRDDVLAGADKRFSTLDKNGDGVIDQADFDAMRKDMADYRVQRMAHRLGAGPDGKVTREQFMAKAAERFARLDVDGDGRIGGRGRGGHGWGHGRGGGHGGMMDRHHQGDMHRGNDAPAQAPAGEAAPAPKN